ncbi:Hypothetical protein, predicted lipoprotein [Mycoplasmopsis agalactiae 14628]|uniref:Lipoprotein n=1 Tax=Mycoplasmopsis agalactiae 14628 TaxID=1110504 RepID=I5D5Y8_MYCAA|nr:hypothetical protein [Mycoplasmopsis agalactiae]EIN15097.1 Hypothetical protein, predicted lipoprotein [Mycoplasmopsis agalactiae 14628]
MKRDGIKKLSILTLSPLSVVSTFAFISASCDTQQKIDVVNPVGGGIKSPTNIQNEIDKQNDAHLESTNPAVNETSESRAKTKKDEKKVEEPKLITAPTVSTQSLKDILKDSYNLFDENIKDATKSINEYAKTKNDAKLYEAVSYLEQLISEIESIDSIKDNSGIKKILEELKSSINKIYELFDFIDNNEYGIKELENILSEIEKEFKAIKSTATDNWKEIIDSISFLIKNLLEKAKSKINLNSERSNKDLNIASGYIDELVENSDVARLHLDKQIAKLVKEYQDVNQKYQPVKKKFDEIDNGWYRFRAFFSSSMSNYYQKIHNELTQYVNQINKIVKKIESLKNIKANLTKTPIKKAK